MKIEVNEREALLIVTALGTYQNRIGQHTSWNERKRMRTIRARLADAVTIDDKEEISALRHAMSNTRRRIGRGIALGLEVSTLRERIKTDTGITDKRVKDDEQAEA